MDVTELTAKGLERKPRLLALKRQAANLEGSQGEFHEQYGAGEGGHRPSRDGNI